MDDISLISGAVPVVVLVLGGLGLVVLLVLLVRAGRIAAVTAVVAVAVGVVVMLGVNWLVTRGLGLFPEPQSRP